MNSNQPTETGCYILTHCSAEVKREIFKESNMYTDDYSVDNGQIKLDVFAKYKTTVLYHHT